MEKEKFEKLAKQTKVKIAELRKYQHLDRLLPSVFGYKGDLI